MEYNNTGVKFAGVPSEYLEAAWQGVEPYLTRALARGNQYRTVDILKKLITADMQLWIAFRGEFHTPDVQAFCITELNITPLQKECLIVWCSGKERDNWKDYIKEIEEWAKARECDVMKVMTRPGWERVHKTYKKTHSLLEKAL
jgi:hypothetical protein